MTTEQNLKPDADMSRYPRSLQTIKADCRKIAEVDKGDTHTMASRLMEMSLDYYRDVRRQANQSFYSALGAAGVGTGFFVYAAWKMAPQGVATSRSYIALLAGVLVQVISGINFYLYAKAAHHFTGFHICLERANRFLLVNTFCDNLTDKNRRDEMREELIRVVANAPMLTLEQIEGSTGFRANIVERDENVAPLKSVEESA